MYSHFHLFLAEIPRFCSRCINCESALKRALLPSCVVEWRHYECHALSAGGLYSPGSPRLKMDGSYLPSDAPSTFVMELSGLCVMCGREYADQPPTKFPLGGVVTEMNRII